MSTASISRRTFTQLVSTTLTSAAFGTACGGAYVSTRALPKVSSREAPVITALRFGISAPSAHNTQPWKLRIVAKDEALLFTDPDRLLPLTDPPSRQIHISHGTLLETTSIAATALGYRAKITPLPEGDVGPAEFGHKPTAHIALSAVPSIERDPLFDALGVRRTSRLPHVDPPPSAAEVDKIVKTSSLPGVTSNLLTDKLTPYFDVIHGAMAAEVAVTETYGETLRWFRFDRDEVNAKGDGLNLQTAGADGFFTRMFLTRDNFLSDSNRELYLESFREVVDSTRGLLVLTTSDNQMSDWIATGRAYVRAQLMAALGGLYFHPVSQSLQELDVMAPYEKALAKLLPVPKPGKVQMLVRVGRTDEPAVSPRRPLDRMLIGSTG